MSTIPDFLIGKGTHKLISQRRYAKCLSLCNRLRADIITASICESLCVFKRTDLTLPFPATLSTTNLSTVPLLYVTALKGSCGISILLVMQAVSTKTFAMAVWYVKLYFYIHITFNMGGLKLQYWLKYRHFSTAQ